MKCSKCKGSSIGWGGELVKTDDGYKAVVTAACSICKRTYRARIDWKYFERIQIGGVEGEKKNEQPEDILPPGEAKKLINSLAQQMEMPGTQDPRGR